FYLRLQVADEAGVLSKITTILAEHDISIDALLQRESAEGERQTDVIILTHDTVESRMRAAIARMQALPTVLAPIVSLRKEELAGSTSRPEATPPSATSATSCSRAWRPTAGCTCRRTTRRSTRRRLRAGAACRTRTWPSRSSRCTSTTSRAPT